MKEEYYVYAYLDPRKPGFYKYENYIFSYEPIYIGKGIKNRIEKHLKLKVEKLKYNSKFYNTLNKLKNLNLEPIKFKLEENLDDYNAKQKEIELITKIGRLDLNKGTLLNLTDGGEGCLRRKQSKKEKLKRSNSLRGRITTIEARKNIVKGKGSNFILQYDVNGNFIKEWYSIRDAKRNGFKGLGHALFKNRNMSGGYLWFKKLSDEIPIKIDSYIPHNKTLNKYKKLIANGN